MRKPVWPTKHAYPTFEEVCVINEYTALDSSNIELLTCKIANDKLTFITHKQKTSACVPTMLLFKSWANELTQ